MNSTGITEKPPTRKALVPIHVIGLCGVGLVAAILVAGGVLITKQLTNSASSVDAVLAGNKAMAQEAVGLSAAVIPVFETELRVMAHLVRLQETITPLQVLMTQYLAEVGDVQPDDLSAAMQLLTDSVTRLEADWPESYPEDILRRVVGASGVLSDIVSEVVETDSPAQRADMTLEVQDILAAAVDAIASIREHVTARVQEVGVEVQAHAERTSAAAVDMAEHAGELTDSLDTVQWRVRVILVAVMVVAAVVLTLGFLILRRRLSYTAELVERLADGEVETSVGVATRDNLGRVLDAVHRLIVSMRDRASLAERIARRDLAGQFESTSERDTLGKALRGMLENLNADVGQVSSAASTLDGEARQMAAGSTQLARGSAEQAATISEIATAVEQLAEQTRSNASQARTAHETADEARGLADEGAVAMTRLQESMRETEDVSREITSVVTLIDEIAFQTNLLALNATIEAARAGEAGTGFTVVAKEVRALSQRCAEAAKDTSRLLVRSSRNVQDSRERADETGRSLTSIAEAVAQMA